MRWTAVLSRPRAGAVREKPMSEQNDNEAPLTQRINEIIDRIRPHIKADGGDIEVVEVDRDSGRVSIRFSGACRGCPMSAITLKMGVERHLKELVPEVTEVVAVD